MLQWTWEYRYPFDILISIPLNIYLEVELLDHMVILFLVCWGTSILFSSVAVVFYIPTNSVQWLQFPHILSNPCYLLYFW